MHEFFLIIQNTAQSKSELSADHHLDFVKKCESYINDLKKRGKLIAAQPIVREGMIISGNKNGWKEESLNLTNEIQVGYYHIFANDMNEAIEIAKQNPEFEYTATARIEVRPIKTKEERTGFIYPAI
jgi:hypothetical protein